MPRIPGLEFALACHYLSGCYEVFSRTLVPTADLIALSCHFSGVLRWVFIIFFLELSLPHNKHYTQTSVAFCRETYYLDSESYDTHVKLVFYVLLLWESTCCYLFANVKNYPHHLLYPF